MVDMAGDTQAGVIAFLASGEAFGGAAVEAVETHTAMVFLAGDRAYKLKKNVKYSYLDYSTAARRRASCEAELRINRRFAPMLYLGVEPIVERKAGAYALGGEGQIVDWVVAMKRFDQNAQLDRMAQRHALPLDLMWRLADRIAEVHSEAQTSTAFGGAEGLWKAIDITIQNLRLAQDHGLPAQDVADWVRQVTALHATMTPDMDRRRMTGHVRACHGDLHLRNICLIGGEPTLFDAIEFDESLATTDVLYDLAFLLMDLEHRELQAHGNRIFNRYLDRADEADGIRLIRLFMSVRAAIRAQISIAAALHRHDAGDIGPYIDQARSYLDLALALLRPAPARLVAVGGASGTGKSTLAYHLAPSLWGAPGARVLRSDVVRKTLAGVGPEERLPESAYTPERNREVYAELRERTRLCLESGCSVVVDAVFAKEAERLTFKSLADETGVSFRGVWLEAQLDVLKSRIDRREHDASDATGLIAEKQLGWIEEPRDWMIVDASRESAAVAADTLDRLVIA
jgi:aminoglycoside phosphotransferase family enzyme/predicted kinase